MSLYNFAYISFDVVPAPKGASTHIMAFAKAIASEFGNIELVTVASPKSVNQAPINPDINHITLPAKGKYLIDRILYFQMMLIGWQQEKFHNYIQYDLIHFRSIFEGLPLVLNKHQIARKFIFEVNGLPSIELKYRYPKVAEDGDLLYKLTKQEDICLQAADLIITPSDTTKKYLQNKRGVKQNIQVIPNGVDTSLFTYQTPKENNNIPFKLLYFGTLASWQGVHLAIEALALINRDFPAKLTIVGLGRDRQIVKLKKLAHKLKVESLVTISHPVSQRELVQKIHQSHAVVAPLTANDRNTIQGCCPLKILEAMATGTPVIASDLSVVRELGIHEKHFLLVKPGSAKSIKDAVLSLIARPQLAKELGINARQQIETSYTWQKAGDSLVKSYYALVIKTINSL